MRVPNLEAAVEKLKKDGMRLVSDEIKVGAGGHRYVFVHPSSAGGVLLELVEEQTAPQATIMLLLAADTSGKHGSIALAHCDAGAHCEMIEIVPLMGARFRQTGPPNYSAACET